MLLLDFNQWLNSNLNGPLFSISPFIVYQAKEREQTSSGTMHTSKRVLSLLLLLFNPTQISSAITFPLDPIPAAYDLIASILPAAPIIQYISIWDIPILATSTVSQPKIQHVSSVLAEFLDNDNDG